MNASVIAICILPSMFAATLSAAHEVEYLPLHAWQFQGEDSQGWRWMAPVQEAGEDGVLLTTQQNGPFMRLDGISQRALDVSAVEIAFAYEDGSEREAPKGLRLYWARAADTERAGGWPFSNERSAPFMPIEDGEGGRWRADIAFHGNWIGTITALFVEITLPDDVREEGGQIQVQEFVFMEERLRSEDDTADES